MYNVIASGSAIKLTSDSSNIEILPGCGAILNRWEIKTPAGLLQAVEGYENEADFAAHCESKGFRSCKLSPYVCRLKNSVYSFEGKDYKIGKFELNGSAIHGLLYNVPFQVISSEAGSQGATVVLQYAYDGNDPGFPHPYIITIAYTLQEGNTLALSTSVQNISDGYMPLADGWHPYFHLGATVNELEWCMASNTMVEFDDTLVPTGKLIPDERFSTPRLIGDTAFDNCFLLHKPLNGPACILRNPVTNVTLHITPDENYPYLQVYIPPHRQSIAIENLSSAPDAFNNKMGLIALEPGESISFNTRYTLTV
jgi:aldose 1-epimerase